MSDRLIKLGARIKSLRNKLGLSQDQVAERAGLNPNYFSQVENGKANLRFANLVNLALALDVEPYELLEYDHEVSREELLEETTRLLAGMDNEELKNIYRIVRLMSH